MKRALVCGAGGFIGSHLVKRLKKESFWARGVDLKYPEFSPSPADDFVIADLRKPDVYERIYNVQFDEVYQLAADMGGAGFIFTGENDAQIIHNNALINLNTVRACLKYNPSKVFFSSSACVYSEYNQADPDNPNCSEGSAYPAAPDSEYGWEKLFSERLYLTYHRNCGLNVRIARFHNIFGPEGAWTGGREKAPAAICRKIAMQNSGGTVEIWGDGRQTRSFLYIDECLDGVRRLMDSDLTEPVNIGSEEMVTINELVQCVAKIAGKTIHRKYIDGPLGVRGRNSDNRLVREKLGWEPKSKLEDSLRITYHWIEDQIDLMSRQKGKPGKYPIITKTPGRGERAATPDYADVEDLKP